MTRPTRASYSSISTYETCPASYKFYYLDGIKSEAGAAANRGSRLHTACELYLKDELPLEKLTIDFRHIKGYLSMMKDRGAKAEEVWLCDKDWGYQTEEDDTTMVKSIVDIHYMDGNQLIIYDLKTGSAYPEHAEQLQLYAVSGFSRYPEAEWAVVAPLYLDGPVAPTTYHRKDVAGLQKFWKIRALAPVQAEEFPATPSGDACRWCDYRKSKGGPCEF